jgi:lysozyme family protein
MTQTLPAAIDAMIERTIGVEGGYSNNPADRGGPTRWGVTWANAKKYAGYTGDMRVFPRELAKKVFLERYVKEPGFDRVAEISPRLAEELIDTGINMGQDIPARWLQEWLNAYNLQGRLYPDINEDADIGPATIASLVAFKRSRGAEAEKVMLRGLNCSQGERYKQLARSRMANEEFVFGWLRTRVEAP